MPTRKIPSTMVRRSRAGFGLLLCVGGLLAGCGEDQSVPLYPTRGQVLIGGKPEAGVEIRLHPVDKLGDVEAPRPFATTNADGSFVLGTFKTGDGAPSGRYLATFFWPGAARGSVRVEDRLAGNYTEVETSSIEVTIAEAKTELEPFQLDQPRTDALARAMTPARGGGGVPGAEGFGAP